ncbi:MAG: glutathione S-transferase N-terminal domain-containing protein [Algicola sp.]|nr:glutathione S-transferase N-terminal domain-containing protein [Algicola sp.]
MKSLVLKLVRNALGQLIILIDFITRPQRMTRSEHLQGEVDLQSKDLSLYQFHACPFCVKVRRSMIRLNLNIELRDARNNEQHRQELLEEGGRIKVPCLRIQEGDQVTWLYDSKAIITYLDQRFGVQSNLPESTESAESA